MNSKAPFLLLLGFMMLCLLLDIFFPKPQRKSYKDCSRIYAKYGVSSSTILMITNQDELDTYNKKVESAIAECNNQD